jgi:transposase, IS30 family
MSHHHFTLSDRIRIQDGIENNQSRRKIAQRLGVSHTAINQEVHQNSVILELVTTSRINKPRILSLDLRTRRGKGEVPEKMAALASFRYRLERFARGQPSYDAEIAQTLYLERRANASGYNYRLVDGNELAELITQKLTSKDRDSPEQIIQDLRKESGAILGYQTIYRWIKRSSNREKLEKGLRRRGRRYRYSSGSLLSWNKTKDKRSIHTRPMVIEQLIRYGDLEGDTIFGKDTKDRLLTHVDRVTGLLSLSMVRSYDSYKVYKQTGKDINRVFGNGVCTITYDNGSEFAAWKKTEQQLKATIYFADPYRSSQRGRNENTNGLVRDYFPKGTDFKKITKKQVQEVEDILNKRSRKRYNWRNPFEQREHVLGIS